MNRLYGVMNTRLKDRAFLAGNYSIADMACVGWVRLVERQGQDINEFPHLKRWLETLKARPAVKRGMALRVEEAAPGRHEGSEGAGGAVRPARAQRMKRFTPSLARVLIKLAVGPLLRH